MSYSDIITQFQLEQCMPRCKEPELWAPLLNEQLFTIGVIESKQVAAFIAQTGHESLDYNVLEENLNYSEDSLLRVFGKYFRDTSAKDYARNPKKIASKVYANRMGNGSEESGDGWRFRGRGILQVTGYNNYKELSEYIFGDDTLIENPDLLLDKNNALKSAIWYWDVNNLKRITDFVTLTKRINGGTNGLEDRYDRYYRAVDALM